jgi:ParB-like chromosome segregation protein Spo0J
MAISAMAIAAMAVARDTLCRLTSRTEAMAEDEFLEALTALEGILEDHGERSRLIKKRIAQIRRGRAKGASYTELVSNNDNPLIVQLLTESSIALDTGGAGVRRAEARALYAEGLTMEQIAERFGVSRQRVSTLLRRAHEPE